MGRLPIPLSDSGRKQIERIASHLRSFRVAGIWTSPLARTVETARLAAAAIGEVPVHTDEGLNEVAYGRWEGRTFAELLDDPAYHRFHKDPLGAAIPEGESLLQVRTRVLEAMERVAMQVDGGTAVIVSHGDPIRIVLCECLGIPLTDFRRLRVDNGGLSAIDVLGNWVEVKCINLRPDPEHLLGAERDGARAIREGDGPPIPESRRARGASLSSG